MLKTSEGNERSCKKNNNQINFIFFISKSRHQKGNTSKISMKINFNLEFSALVMDYIITEKYSFPPSSRITYPVNFFFSVMTDLVNWPVICLCICCHGHRFQAGDILWQLACDWYLPKLSWKSKMLLCDLVSHHTYIPVFCCENALPRQWLFHQHRAGNERKWSHTELLSKVETCWVKQSCSWSTALMQCEPEINIHRKSLGFGDYLLP